MKTEPKVGLFDYLIVSLLFLILTLIIKTEYPVFALIFCISSVLFAVNGLLVSK